MLAMHAPDGFLEPDVALATAVLSVGVLAWCLRSLDDVEGRRVPLAGLAAAFIFAAQMINFPVAAGTSGHLIGAALAAILLGPRLGAIVVSVVIIVQALLFADGGLTAIGYNLLNMAIVPAFGGWAIFRLSLRGLGSGRAAVTAATALGAGCSVVLSAMTFSLEWLFGASAPVAFDSVFVAMVGVHFLIGLGEGAISASIVGAVVASRPDLVAGAPDAALDAAPVRVRTRTFLVAGLLSAAVIGAVLSQFAATAPDGLERVAASTGITEGRAEQALARGPFSDYATRGIDNQAVSLAIAGLTGVVLCLTVGTGIIGVARRTALAAQS